MRAAAENLVWLAWAPTENVSAGALQRAEQDTLPMGPATGKASGRVVQKVAEKVGSANPWSVSSFSPVANFRHSVSSVWDKALVLLQVDFVTATGHVCYFVVLSKARQQTNLEYESFGTGIPGNIIQILST